MSIDHSSSIFRREGELKVKIADMVRSYECGDAFKKRMLSAIDSVEIQRPPESIKREDDRKEKSFDAPLLSMHYEADKSKTKEPMISDWLLAASSDNSTSPY